MVKIEITFPSIDAAIVALGKMAVAPAVSRKLAAAGDTTSAGALPSVPPAPAATASEKKTRKPRADKGKEREPYGPREPAMGASATANPPTTPATAEPATTDAGKAAEQAANPQSTTADAPKADTQPAATTAPTLEDATKALASVFETHGMSTAQDLLARYGAKRLRDVKPETYAKFIEHAAKVVADKAAV